MAQTIVTYDLRLGEKQSQKYYEDVRSVAQVINQRLNERFKAVLNDYGHYIEQLKIEKRRKPEEYGLELLVIGVLWQCYSGPAQCLKPYQAKLLIRVNQKRVNTHYLKRIYSDLKGRLIKKYIKHISEENNKSMPMTQYEILEKWIDYLRATGEFDEEVDRLFNWMAFLKERADWQRIMQDAIIEATHFYQLAHAKLSIYLPHVTDFIRESTRTHEGKEDFIFVQRRAIEYYLNMVGAEILNEALKEQFKHTKKRYIFLPSCMAYHSKQKCRRKKSSKGFICQGCTKVCPIQLTTSIGKKYHAKTIIVEHGSALYKTKVASDDGARGVIGVACTLNLLSGGWKAIKLGYVPQCVLLDWCGCKQHWHKEGLVTDINRERLVALLS